MCAPFCFHDIIIHWAQIHSYNFFYIVIVDNPLALQDSKYHVSGNMYFIGCIYIQLLRSLGDDEFFSFSFFLFYT